METRSKLRANGRGTAEELSGHNEVHDGSWREQEFPRAESLVAGRRRDLELDIAGCRQVGGDHEARFHAGFNCSQAPLDPGAEGIDLDRQGVAIGNLDTHWVVAGTGTLGVPLAAGEGTQQKTGDERPHSA